MSSFVLMRLLESAPRRYDLGIRLLSIGGIDRVRNKIASQVNTGDRVLDIGCGTGTLAILCAQKGAPITAIDISPQMLDIAKEKALAGGVEDRIEFRQMSAIDLDETFSARSFDKIVSTLVFSELSGGEQGFVLRECHRLLRRGGTIMIADEVPPRSWPLRILYSTLRFPLVLLTYVLTQTTTRAVSGLADKIANAGFQIESRERILLGNLVLIRARNQRDEGGQ